MNPEKIEEHLRAMERANKIVDHNVRITLKYILETMHEPTPPRPTYEERKDALMKMRELWHELSAEEIVKRCMEFDEQRPHAIIYFLSTNTRTYKLGWSAIFWSTLDHGERYSMVKNGNYFLTEEEADAAVKRALARDVE